MKNYPTSFIVRGRDWSLQWQKGLKEKMGCFGLTLVEDQSIAVDNKILNRQQEADTVLHELLHVCYAATSLPHVIGGDEKERDEQEEIIVDSLTPAVLSLIVDNPELIEQIQIAFAEGKLEE